MAEPDIKFYGTNGNKGGGYATDFLPVQSYKLQFVAATLQRQGVSCKLAFVYGNDTSLAILTFENGEGASVAEVKLLERWENFGDKAKPNLHQVYNYDVYAGTPEDGLTRVEFMQMQEQRGLPAKIFTAFQDAATAAARDHDLLPKIRTLAFGARKPG